MSTNISKVNKAYLSPRHLQSQLKRSTVKLPDIHKIQNFTLNTKRSSSHVSLQNSITDMKKRPSNRQRTAEFKSKRPSQMKALSPTSALDEDISKLENLTVRNTSARYELISLQERMLEIKLKSIIRHNSMNSIAELDDYNLYGQIENCYSNSKKSIDGLMNKYKGFSSRRAFPALTSPVSKVSS